MKKTLFVVFALCFLSISSSLAWGEELDEPVDQETIEVEVLDLETAQGMALQGNPSIGAAGARIEQAKARVEQAMAANLPSVDVVGSVGMARYADATYDNLAAAQSDVDQVYEQASLGLQATWLLFDGYARKFRQEQAEYGEDASEADRLNNQRLLLAAVADAFFNAQLAQASLEIAEADQKFYEQQLQDAEYRFEAGAGSKGDVLNIQVQLNAGKGGVINGKHNYEAARYGLAALLGLENAQLAESMHLAKLDKECNLADEPLAEEELIKEAMATRPDIKQLAMQLHAAEAGIGQAKAKDWPIVQLAGSVNGNTKEELFPAGEDFSGSLALNFSWNLYSGGATKAAQTEARQAKREVAYTLANLRNSIAAEVRQDITLLSAAREQVRLQRESVGLVEENRDLAKSEYEAGSASLVRLNEAQRDLTATHGRLASAVASYHQAKHRLLSAVGRNLEPFVDLLEVDLPDPEVEEEDKEQED